ncbi:putative TrkA domain protein [Campylobacter iguaniorum]|uniref:COG3400 family protein n=1 Tax=Campylobacter iguaniorum TaxID=1244531 RepID=UPI0007C95732|nr:TrkA C-terminal domain-containing protein [Campylobacter iguaniorum]ANE35898.1 putative TrkA domain protein [Campylobacter iguaniorum]
MKNILIIADGILAKHFLERLFNSKNNSLHNYTIITYNDETIPQMQTNFENFSFFSFDPTSLAKLSKNIKEDYEKFLIIMDSEFDTKSVYENLKKISQKTEIDIMDQWGLEDEITTNDFRLRLIDARKILSSRFMDFLPDVPVIADNIGLGIGEIMEVKVPNGSSYVYRHVGNIRKKKWKIAMIYRSQDYIIATPETIILPNDVLLIVGEPRVLESVFRAVKKEPGQFPSPFGNNIYLILDMKRMSQERINLLIKDAILIHSKLNNKKLFIKVINPTLTSVFSKIKKLATKSIYVSIDYQNTDLNITKANMGELDIGLIITDTKTFNAKKQVFWTLKTPVLKIGEFGFATVKSGVIVGNEDDAEHHSSVIMDCCKQLDFDIDFYHFDTKFSSNTDSLIEHFENLSKLFNKKVNIIKDGQNPLLKLRKRDDILQFISLSQKIFENRFLSIFSKDTDKLHYMLDKNYQLFIPQNDKI